MLTASILERNVQHINLFFFWVKAKFAMQLTAQPCTVCLCKPSRPDLTGCPGWECWAAGMFSVNFLLTPSGHTSTQTWSGQWAYGITPNVWVPDICILKSYTITQNGALKKLIYLGTEFTVRVNIHGPRVLRKLGTKFDRKRGRACFSSVLTVP